MPAHRTNLEQQQLQPDRRRLAQEDAGRVDAREPESVAGALPRLDGHAALNRQHRREQERDPEDARCGVTERRLVWADGEGQQDEDEHGKGDDLPEGDAGARLNAEVFPGDQHSVMPHGWLPPRVRSRAGPAAGTAVRVTRRPPVPRR